MEVRRFSNEVRAFSPVLAETSKYGISNFSASDFPLSGETSREPFSSTRLANITQGTFVLKAER